MMCHRIGRPPIATIGLGMAWVSSASRVPRPPARITTCIVTSLGARRTRSGGGGQPRWSAANLGGHGRDNQGAASHPPVQSATEGSVQALVHVDAAGPGERPAVLEAPHL